MASQEVSVQQALNEWNTFFTPVLVGEAEKNMAFGSSNNSADETQNAVENLITIMHSQSESSYSSSGNLRYPEEEDEDLDFEPISEGTQTEIEVPAIVGGSINDNALLSEMFETPSFPELETNFQLISESEG